MRNIGPKSRAWLAEIDIRDIEDLRALGAVETYARLRFRFGRSISRNMLHAMAAALADIDWRELSPEHKAELDHAADERLAAFDVTKI
jgi:DNA transformation protein and related proteins